MSFGFKFEYAIAQVIFSILVPGGKKNTSVHPSHQVLLQKNTEPVLFGYFGKQIPTFARVLLVDVPQGLTGMASRHLCPLPLPLPCCFLPPPPTHGSLLVASGAQPPPYAAAPVGYAAAPPAPVGYGAPAGRYYA